MLQFHQLNLQIGGHTQSLNGFDDLDHRVDIRRGGSAQDEDSQLWQRLDRDLFLGALHGIATRQTGKTDGRLLAGGLPGQSNGGTGLTRGRHARLLGRFLGNISYLSDRLRIEQRAFMTNLPLEQFRRVGRGAISAHSPHAAASSTACAKPTRIEATAARAETSRARAGTCSGTGALAAGAGSPLDRVHRLLQQGRIDPLDGNHLHRFGGRGLGRQFQVIHQLADVLVKRLRAEQQKAVAAFIHADRKRRRAIGRRGILRTTAAAKRREETETPESPGAGTSAPCPGVLRIHIANGGGDLVGCRVDKGPDGPGAGHGIAVAVRVVERLFQQRLDAEHVERIGPHQQRVAGGIRHHADSIGRSLAGSDTGQAEQTAKPASEGTTKSSPALLAASLSGSVERLVKDFGHLGGAGIAQADDLVITITGRGLSHHPNNFVGKGKGLGVFATHHQPVADHTDSKGGVGAARFSLCRGRDGLGSARWNLGGHSDDSVHWLRISQAPHAGWELPLRRHRGQNRRLGLRRGRGPGNSGGIDHLNRVLSHSGHQFLKVLRQQGGAPLLDVDHANGTAPDSSRSQGLDDRLDIQNLFRRAADHDRVANGIRLHIRGAGLDIAQHSLERIGHLGGLGVPAKGDQLRLGDFLDGRRALNLPGDLHLVLGTGVNHDGSVADG